MTGWGGAGRGFVGHVQHPPLKWSRNSVAVCRGWGLGVGFQGRRDWDDAYDRVVW